MKMKTKKMGTKKMTAPAVSTPTTPTRVTHQRPPVPREVRTPDRAMALRLSRILGSPVTRTPEGYRVGR